MIQLQDSAQSAAPAAVAHFTSVVPVRAGGNAGLAIYRDSAANELLGALADNFPTIVRMLGADAFREMAVGFIAHEAPTAQASIFYGDNFPDVLRQAGPRPSADYIADIAAIDAASAAARQIAEAAAIPYEPCGSLFDDLLSRPALHPSTILLRSQFPAVTGWRVNQPRGDRWVRRWEPEDALVACTRLDAEVWRLPGGGFAFLSALAAGGSLSDASDAGVCADASFDVLEMAAVLAASNIVTHVARARGRVPRRRHTAFRLPASRLHPRRGAQQYAAASSKP